MSAPVRQDAARSLTILGATGSVGQTTLELVVRHRDRYGIEALTGGRNWRRLADWAHRVHPRFVAIADTSVWRDLKQALSGLAVEAAAGPDAVVEAARRPADLVMSSIVGVAGLAPTMAAVRRGCTVAIANKEPLVAAGAQIMQAAADHGTTVLPVDSEHNAIFQVFEESNRDQIEQIVLTASGGPFRQCGLEELKDKTPEQALAHPNWDMGAKISIDSATMMNKGLEIIEAHHLFGFAEDRIGVLVHPQSVVHGLVAYSDGSVLAHMAAPDMSSPIAHALAWPDRVAVPQCRLDLLTTGDLSFEAPDPVRFPALRLAREVLRQGGGMPIVFNAANEIAVAAFLDRAIGFTDIVRVIEAALERQSPAAPGSVPEVLQLDAAVRELARAIIGPAGRAGHGDASVAMPAAQF